MACNSRISFDTQNAATALSKTAESLKRLSTIGVFSSNVNDTMSTEVNEFVMALHRIPLETCIFDKRENFFKFIESQLNDSLRVTSFIFHHPRGFTEQVRMSLLAFITLLYSSSNVLNYMFYRFTRRTWPIVSASSSFTGPQKTCQPSSRDR